ncbi:hypothetical protein PJWF_00073 [Achromobacter phage JWF]|uniref:hypothetical protein n=1 Tax=Achromobacter phage JWF TaxID=1589748 RepID=UPI000588E539|nr:hypothetical protein AXJ13_gp115 [Achromobacter phage JWF]AJD82966.1 hypothetical protein PJWF_00073 [Achromobacter phage JWF]
MSNAAVMLVTYPRGGVRQRFFKCQKVLDSWKETMTVFKKAGAVKDFMITPLYALPKGAKVETR